VASIFPDSPAAHDDGVVCAVRDCPKPPPTRLSLTFPTLNNAVEVWFLAAGSEKADAVQQAWAGTDPVQLPASGVHGRAATVWWLDEKSASALPQDG
jgi:6-phosphogluconolactonase